MVRGLRSQEQDTCAMLKITVIEGQRQRRVIVEGKLIGLWTAELTSAYKGPEQIFKTGS